jgi:hypothetical protein
MRSRMVLTSTARSVTSRGPVRLTSCSKSPSATSAGLGGEPVQRPDHRRPQPEREDHHDDRQADGDGNEHAVQHGGRVVQAATAWVRAAEMWPCSTPILDRSASKSALPVRTSG